MSASLSLVLASALTASAGVSSPSYPIRETAEATADSSSSSNDPLHPTYVVESDLHDVWKAASQKERPLVDEFDYDSVSDNSVIERSVSLMDHDRDCFRSFAIEFDKKGNEIIAKAKQEENILKVTEIVYEARKDSLTVTLELLDLYFNIAVPLSSVVTDVVIPIVEKIIDMVFSSLENQYGAEAESGTDMLQIAQYFRQFASVLDVKADSANADGAPEKVLFFLHLLPLYYAVLFRNSEQSLRKPADHQHIGGVRT